MGLSDALIGTKLPAVSYSWGPDETILYALGVGARPPEELRYLDEARGPRVIPTFALIANWWAVKDLRSYLDSGSAPMVHASQCLKMLRPIPPAGEVMVNAQVAAVWDKGRHSLVEVDATGVDADGPLFRTRSATMVLGTGGWGGERGPSGDPPTVDTEPVHRVDDYVRPEQAAIYRLSGDRNPLHIDPDAARGAGFDDVFLHGLCTLGFAARALIATCCDDDPQRLVSIRCRFATPVHLGEPLVTEVWDPGDGTVRFRTSQGTTEALSSGMAQIGAAT